MDPEAAREKFAELRLQRQKTLEAIQKHGRNKKAAKDQIQILANIFTQFRLVPKQLLMRCWVEI